MISNSKQLKKNNMKNLKIAFSLVLLSGLFSFGLMAQGNSGNHDISVEFEGITLLDVVSSTDLNITLAGEYTGVNAGEEITENTVLASNNVNRLHYTVFNPSGGTNTYKINAAATGFTGAGWTIDVTPEAGNFENPNAAGTAGSTFSLRDGGDLVNAIGKVAWTGTDVGADGYGLLYELKVTDFSTFEIDPSTTVNVTYTISEE